MVSPELASLQLTRSERLVHEKIDEWQTNCLGLSKECKNVTADAKSEIRILVIHGEDYYPVMEVLQKYEARLDMSSLIFNERQLYRAFKLVIDDYDPDALMACIKFDLLKEHLVRNIS